MDKAFLALLDEYAPAIRDAIIAGIRDIRDNAILAQIVEMVERGDVEGALRALGYNPAVFNTYFAIMSQAFQAGGALLIARQPKYVTDRTGMKTPLRFNIRDPRAERWLFEQSSGFITGIEDDVRQAVREAMSAGLEQGRNPRSVALDIVGRYDRTTGHREGGLVGLSARDMGWARSTRQKLLTLDKSYFQLANRDARFDATVQAAIDSGRPLPAETIDKLVDRYRAISLRKRGEAIGRTEALAALNRSEYEATRQALERSDLPLAAARKVWDSAGDRRVRNSHRELDGTSVGIDEPFISPATGKPMMHPGDTTLGAKARDVIHCRCKIRYEIDFLYRYRNNETS